MEDLLKLNGAREDKYLSSLITHVICDNPADNSDSYEAKEVFDLPIVKVMNHTKKKFFFKIFNNLFI